MTGESLMGQLHFETRCWYAVQCQPFKERLASGSLARQLGLRVYLPEIKRLVRGRVHYAPFFPRYLFVQADLQTVAISRINAAAGVLKLVTFGEAPPSLRASVIEELRLRIGEINAQGGVPGHQFRPGHVVRLKNGPLQGLEAVFVGPLKPSQRVHVLIEFLGRQHLAEVPVTVLEGTDVPSAHPPRRTRGRGRPIRRA